MFCCLFESDAISVFVLGARVLVDVRQVLWAAMYACSSIALPRSLPWLLVLAHLVYLSFSYDFWCDVGKKADIGSILTSRSLVTTPEDFIGRAS